MSSDASVCLLPQFAFALREVYAMSLLALCTHPQLKDVVFDILDVRDAMPLRLVSNTIRAAVEDFGLQVFAEGIEEENRIKAVEYERLIGFIEHIESEADYGGSRENAATQSLLFSSEKVVWTRLVALNTKANAWSVDHRLQSMLFKVEVIEDDYRNPQAELIYRCHPGCVSYAEGSFYWLPREWGDAELRTFFCGVKFFHSRSSKHIARVLPHMPNLEVARMWVLDSDATESWPCANRLIALTIFRESDANAVAALLKRCTSLRTLNIEIRLTATIVDQLGKMTSQLGALSIRLGESGSFNWIPFARNCRNLRRLHVVQPVPMLGKELLDALVESSNIEMQLLELDYEHVEEVSFTSFLKAKGDRLKLLEVTRASTNNRGPVGSWSRMMETVTSNCPSLRSINVWEHRSDVDGELLRTFTTLSKLQRVGMAFCELTAADIISIGYFGLIRELSLVDIEGMDDSTLCQLAPKLPLLESLTLTLQTASHVGAIAFVAAQNQLVELFLSGDWNFVPEYVAAAIVANRALSKRLTELRISVFWRFGSDVEEGDGADDDVTLGPSISTETLRQLALQCCRLKTLELPTQLIPIPEDILRLFRWKLVKKT